MSFASKFPPAPLSAVAGFINGDRSTNYPKGDDYVNEGVTFISAADLVNGRVDYSRARQISSSAYERLRSGKIQPRDILFCLRGSLGKMAYVHELESGAIASSLVIVRAKESVDSRSPTTPTSQDAQQVTGGLNNGAAQPNLSVAELQRVEIPLPALAAQRHIADILSAYDDLIENSQRRIKILEAIARGLYREWFVHFRFPGHENHSRVASALGEIPQGWETANLETLIKSHIGGGWGKDEYENGFSESAWVIRGTDIPEARYSQFNGVPLRFHSPSNLRSRRLKAGDIVFEVSGGSKGQPVGRSLLITPELLNGLDGDVICASFCKRIEPDPDQVGSELLYLSFVEGYESGEIEQYQVQSTGISNFKWTDYIANTERAIPPKALQEKFRIQVAPIFKQVATIGLTIQNLRCTRDLLLPRLLSGQFNLLETIV